MFNPYWVYSYLWEVGSFHVSACGPGFPRNFSSVSVLDTFFESYLFSCRECIYFWDICCFVKIIFFGQGLCWQHSSLVYKVLLCIFDYIIFEALIFFVIWIWWVFLNFFTEYTEMVLWLLTLFLLLWVLSITMVTVGVLFLLAW